MNCHTLHLRSLAVACFTVASLACTSTYFQTGSATELLSQHRQTSIQIGRKDGRIVMLLDPKLVRDTVWGRGMVDTPEAKTGIAVGDIDWVMTRRNRFDAATTSLVASMLALLALSRAL